MEVVFRIVLAEDLDLAYTTGRLGPLKRKCSSRMKVNGVTKLARRVRSQSCKNQGPAFSIKPLPVNRLLIRLHLFLVRERWQFRTGHE